MCGTFSASDEPLLDLLSRVERLHESKGFAANGGEDPHFRMALLMEEVGEICRCLTKDDGDLAEEHADALIALLGNVVAFGIDIVTIAHRKLDRLERLEPVVINGYMRLVTRAAGS